ncbi:MAG: hypothetical protein ACREFI_06075 [Stellaceae bacterium]
MTTRNRGFRSVLAAGALAALAVSVTAAPAMADWVYGPSGYYYAPSATVYAPAPAYTYTYTEPAYPAPVYGYERGPGVYVDTPVLNFGVGFH